MSELLDIAKGILGRAEGSEQIEVFVSRSRENEVRAYQGEIEDLTTAASDGIGIRVLVDSANGARVGSAWAGSLDEAAVAEALREARDNTRFATEDEFVAFASPDGVAAPQLELSSDDIDVVSLDEKIAMAIELEKAVRGSDSRIRQVDSAGYSDYATSGAIASTTGITATYGRTMAYISVEAIATDGHEDQSGWGMSAGRGPRDIDPEKARRDAVQRCTRMLGAIKPSSRKGVAVFDQRATATLLSIIGGALSGEAVVRGRSFFASRIGEMVASPLFTLVDDPTDPRHFAASPFDGEGLACRRNSLIDAGLLRGFVYDTVSGRRAGVASTGSAQRGGIGGSPSAGVRALQLQPGSKSQEEIFREIGDGFFIESLIGVHSGVNPISGDFSVGATGLLIRDGQLAEPIREVTVASSLQKMLQDVIAIGSDVEWLPGTAAGQTIAINDIALSGS